MATVFIQIKTEAASMQPNPNPELARILRKCAKDVRHNRHTQASRFGLKDRDGCLVGFIEYREEI